MSRAGPHFFEKLDRFAECLALIDGDERLSYSQLQQSVDEFKVRLPEQPALVMLLVDNDIPSIVGYLACLQSGHPVMLADSQLADSSKHNLIEAFSVNLLIQAGKVEHLKATPVTLDPRLALLLSTSGSTGSPKQVALSVDNLHANAESICASLPIRPTDTTITTLPMFYSYGLSVIHTHLLKGACILLNRDGPVSRSFWDAFKSHQVNSFAGVPHSFEMLLRLGLNRMDLPSLRYFTQAGGRLTEDKVVSLAQWAQGQNTQFLVMYGQTEASARMAVNIDPGAKPTSIGQPIAGGHFSLVDDKGGAINSTNTEGELVYRGPNVMLGYAECAAHLAGFKAEGQLKTGDLAWFDKDGDFYISGRLKRFIKPFGLRINLDEVEGLLRSKQWEAWATGTDQTLQIVYKPAASHPDIRNWLSQALGLHPSAIATREVKEIPLLGNQKPDYQAMRELFKHAG